MSQVENMHANKEKVVLAFSGGLDTSYCVSYLQDKGFDVITLTVDTGGFTENNLDDIKNKAKLLGAKEHIFVDGKDTLYKQFIAYIIKGNILRGDVYPLCAGTERILIAQELVQTAKNMGAKYLAHGSTGAGNDQIRFDVALQILAPELKVLSPIRDTGIKREDEVVVLKEKGFPLVQSAGEYSINQSLLGITAGGKETKNSWETPPENIFPGITPLEDTPDFPIEFILSFEKGLPVAIDDKEMEGVEIMDYLAKVGGEHGVGKNIHLGNTILGIKGRVAFAAPAIVTLIHAHKELEKLVQTKWQSFWKEMLSDFYGGFLHEALYFDPVMRDLEALIDSSQQNVTGEVKVKFFKGNIIINGCRSPYSLMDASVATYGEENLLWGKNEVEGFSKIYALQSMLAAKVARKKK